MLKYRVNNSDLKIHIIGIVLAACLLVSACIQEPAIGEMVYEAPVTALVFEEVQLNGGETVTGVVYRKVNDADRLIAQNRLLLIAFFDGRALSNSAIPFLETLCDDFSGSVQIVRVNTDLSFEDRQTLKLLDLLDVSEYPHFSIVRNGHSVRAYTGFDEDIKDGIINSLTQLKS